jgi:hypothetical protein
MMDSRLYDLYKPLRNYLRLFAIETTFYVIWAYINYFQFDQPIPVEIQVHDSIIRNKESPSRGIYEWELALLAREIIANGQTSVGLATQTFQNWNYLASAINKLKEFENHAWPLFGDKETVLREFRRIAHRQFPWQAKLNSSFVLRYFKIYNNPRVKDIIENKIGLTVQQWYTIGMAFMGATLSHPKSSVDPEISIPGISKREFDIFSSFLSADLNTLRQKIEKDVKYDDEFVYTFNPLEYFPLVRIGDFYCCPVINFLIWRITSGIYFDLVEDRGFGQPFGFAFQDYLKEVAMKILASDITKVLSEEKYVVDKKVEDSIDLILSQTDAAIFVEAKTKRMRARSKSQLLSDEAIDKDLDILADNIIQAYATIEDYKNGKYSHFPYQSSLKVYPLIVTMEDWFLLGEDSKTLVKKVRCKIQSKGLSIKYIDEMPYTICSAPNFEHFLQIMNSHQIIDVMRNWFTPEKEGHNFGQFLLTSYPVDKTLTDFFPGDFGNIYSAALAT